MRLEQAAPVARALAHRGDLDLRQGDQVAQAHCHSPRSCLPADSQRPVIQPGHIRNGREVVTYEELVVWCYRVTEHVQRGLIVRRPVRELDESTLVGKRDKLRLGSRAVWEL